MTDNFYAFFESINYASEEQVIENRKIYLPYVMPFLTHVGSPLVLDIGCGRGEWLSLLRDHGFETKGVDLDQGMLASAQEKRLDVQLGDGIEFLKEVADASVAVLSAFHVLEHLTFEKIVEFFEQSRRVLIPGGLLIAETPNPESLHVITSNFYLDPTHIRPIPILQMISLARYYDYSKYSVIRLQEDKEIYQKEEVTFRDLFYGVSKDYALISQKPGGPQELIEELDPCLKYETGIGLDEVLKRLDSRLETLTAKVSELSSSAKNK